MSEEVAIEALLDRIQAHLDARQAALQPASPRATARRRGIFSAEVYERLEEAEAIAEAIHVKPFLVPTRVPLVGRLWHRIRAAAHNLVLFYVNRLAGAQAAFNREVVAGWATLVDDLDAGGRANLAEELADLRREVATLRAQVTALQAQIGRRAVDRP